MRVLIDGRMLLGRFSGVARMVTGIVDRLCLDPAVQVVVLCGNEAFRPWVGRPGIELLVSDFSRRHRTPAARLWWEENRLADWIERSGAALYHATWNHGIPANRPVPAILTVHDLIPWDAPALGLSGWIGRLAYRHSLRSAVRRADRIVTVSGHSATQLARRIGTDPAAIRVIYNGAEPRGVAAPGGGAERPYLLYVGGHEPRKNVESVFQAMQGLWDRTDADLGLHLTGDPDDLSEPARAAYGRLWHKDRVRFLGAPDDVVLAEQYSNAVALLLLSRAEGFGLPALEAMGYGCPVIAASCGSLPEIVGEAGLLVDPDRTEEAVDAVNRVLNPAVAAEIIQKGRRRAAAFTWQRAAEAYALEYLRLGGESRRGQFPPALATHECAAADVAGERWSRMGAAGGWPAVDRAASKAPAELLPET
jgi:glycosyltransferase involved in cell wall biosynthesis